MPTKKPKIQGYVDEILHERFQQWKSDRLIEGDTEALSQILAEYFGLGTSSELIKQQKETAEEFLPKLKEELKREILDEVSREIEPIKTQLKKLDDSYGTLLKYIAEHPLQERVGALEAKWAEEEYLAKHERESPQLTSIAMEALETAKLQMNVIDSYQDLGKRLEVMEALLMSDGKLPEIAEQDDIEFAPMTKISEIEIPFQREPETQGEQDLMDAIYEQNPSITVEEAEEIYKLLVKGDSLQSLQESPIEERLTAKDLAKRLRTSVNTLRRERNNSSFAVWAQKRDAFGLLWSYDAGQKVYIGIKPGEV